MRHANDKGGPPRGNRNARSHGVHSLVAAMRGTRHLDRRSAASRNLVRLMQKLAMARGCSTWDDLPPQLQILTRRISFKDLICTAVEEEILTSAEVSESLYDRYLTWSNSLRFDLMAFGLERTPRDVTDLATAIAYAQHEGTSDEGE